MLNAQGHARRRAALVFWWCSLVSSTSQALADYARLVTALKKELLTGADASPVIVFGGSYGGMLGAWLRLKYPHIVHGAVAASAPVLALAGLTRPRPDPESFAATLTRAAGPAGGAAQECAGNVRRAFSVVRSGGEDEEDHSGMERGSEGSSRAAEASSGVGNVPVGGAWGRPGDAVSDVARMLRVCPGSEPQGEDLGALTELAYWARAAFDYLAMGNYPYATGYILNEEEGEVTLPPWPLREACSYMSDPELETAAEEVLLSALADAIGVYYNATGDLACFSPKAGPNNESSVDQDNWNWQACTEMAMPMSTDGIRDMFWRSTPWDPLEQAEGCEKQFGVSSPQDWAAIQYGGYETWAQASNVVFSNGRLDPWSGLGVLDQTQVGPSIHIIVIDQSAHHLDLFFENPADPVEVKEARRKEMDLVEDWVRQGYQLFIAPEGTTAEMR